jgi:phosphatidyl-myo-inositol dimannoside synthase
VGRPGLAAVSFAGTGGGTAYVARLLRHVFAEREGHDPWCAALDPARYGSVTAAERMRFAAKVLGAQLAGRVDWLAFNHVGIARVEQWLPEGMRLPYAIFVHDVEAWDPDLDRSRLRTLTAARLRVANSRYTADRVTAAHPGIGPVIPCPLGLLAADPARVGPGATSMGLPAAMPANDRLLDAIGPSAVLIVGRMHDTERYKGHDELLESWPEVLARVPEAQLVVVGLGNEVQRLQAKASALGVAKAVLFCGFLPADTLADLWHRIALFAMPSAREGFGIVYLEAMRAGRPCIGSTSDAAGDIIVDGQTGFLVDRTDRSALAGAVTSLLGDPARRLAMGEAGRRRYLAEFTADRFGDRLYDILRETPMIDSRNDG